MDGLLEGLYRAGMIVDEALVGELGTIDLSPFKLVIFGSTVVLDDEHRKLIASRVATGGRHVVFTGYVGWSNGRDIGHTLATAVSGISTTGRDAAVPTSALELDGATEKQTLEPPKLVPVYEVPAAQVVGRWADGSISAAWQKTGQATHWTFGVCPTSPAVLRALGKRAGCHILNDHDDATTLGDGLLMVHTLNGGARTLRLPGGKTLSVTLPARSTTVYDAQTGEVLLGN